MNQIPSHIVAGDTAEWSDPVFKRDGQEFGPEDYELTCELRGMGDQITLTAEVVNGLWLTKLSLQDSAKLRPGHYVWAKRLTAEGIRLTIAQGQMMVEQNIETLGPDSDVRTSAQRALAEAEAALAGFKSSNGRVKRYSIGSRSIEFETVGEILTLINYWRQKVQAEQGIDKDLHVRFTR